MSIITDNIDRLIAERGMKKGEFYAATGITAAAFSQWKLEQSKPSLDKLYAAADVLGVDISDVVSGKNKMYYGGTKLLEMKKTATDIGDGISAPMKLMLSIFETLSEEDQWSILLQAQEKARNQKGLDSQTKTE